MVGLNELIAKVFVLSVLVGYFVLFIVLLYFGFKHWKASGKPRRARPASVPHPSIFDTRDRQE